MGVVEVFGRLDQQIDLFQPFHAARPDVTGNDATQRSPVLAGEWPAIHFPGEQYIALKRPVEWDRSAEMDFGSFLRTTVCTDKFNVSGLIVDPGKIENIH